MNVCLREWEVKASVRESKWGEWITYRPRQPVMYSFICAIVFSTRCSKTVPWKGSSWQLSANSNMDKRTCKSELMEGLLVLVLMHEIKEDPSTAESSPLAKCW